MRKRMLLLVFVIASIFLLLSGCDKVGITTGTIPVYRGMTVLNEINTTTSFYQQETDNPETDDPIDDIFQDDIEDAFGIITSEEVEYYVLPNTTLYIHITVYNPDQFEILSFSMNGKKYQSYEFEDGSNSEVLILEVTIDENPGVREFTLDGIKYIDGTTINDVLMDGNQTVKVGVEHTNLPFSLTENIIVGSTSIILDAKVTDYADLILEAGLSPKFFIYDGLSIVYEQDLGFDVTHIDADQLTYNKDYSYAIAAAYDTVDGQGVVVHILEDGTFTTLPLYIIEPQNIDQTSIQIQINDLDSKDVATITSIQLYDGAALVQTSTTIDQALFTELYSDHAYQIKVNYEYNIGDGIQTDYLTYDAQTVAKTLPTLNYLDLSQTQTSLSFDFELVDIDEIATVLSLDLYLNNILIQNKTLDDTFEFDNLLSNTDYEIRLNYTYDLNDSNGIQTSYISSILKTLEKTAPILDYIDVAQTQTSIAFDVDITDVDEIATVSSIELYLDETLVESKTLDDTLEFMNLLSNTDYEVRTNYTYDLNDGNGIQTSYISSVLKTLEKTMPTLDITTYETSYDHIDFDYQIEDIDEVGYIKAINLYEDETLVQSLEDLTLKNISDVIADTLYTLEIIYAYDLNDGIGEQDLITTQEGFTKPYLSVISTEIINTERLTEGDTIRMEVEVDNPSNIDFSEVIINGETYPISNVSTQHSIYLEFIVDDSFTGGETAFVVEQIIGSKHGVERIFDTTQNNTGYAFINGDITIKSISIMDAYDNPIDKVMPGDVFYVKVVFDNPTGYDITNLSMSNYSWDEGNNTNFTLSEDKTTAVFSETAYYRNQILNYNVRSFTYGDDTFGFKTKDVDGVSAFIVSVTNSAYTYIYTADDLKNMKDGYAYKLANDIDLDDVTWEPKDLSFVVLDGNGYAIKNLSIVKTYTDTDVHLGLFKNINYSTITNLTIENFLFLVDMQRDQTSNNFNSYAGFLASNSYMSSYTKINVYGELSIESGLGYDNQTGGLLGRSDNVSMERIYVNANISSNDNRIGGLVGNAYETTISKSFTEGKIFGNNETAGLIGYASNSKITNSYSNATINVVENGAGLVGSANGIYILDSYYEGVIITTNEWNHGAGIISYGNQITLINVFSIAFDDNNTPLNAIVDSWGEYTFENVYTHTTDYDREGILEASYDDIFNSFNDIWDLNIWAFTDEKVVLKWTPSIRFTNIIESENFIGFDYATTDFDMVGQIESISLYKGDELVETITDLNIDRFEGLRHNTSYILVIKYVYNYGDQLGDQIIEVKKEVKTTPAEGTPEIANLEFGVTHDTINFSYDLIDPNGIGVFDSIKLYDENQVLVTELDELDDLEFIDLLSNHMYRLVIKYGYTLDELYGAEYNTKEVIIRTNPYVSFNTTNVLNTDALFIGDTLVINIDIDNPDEIEFTEAMINGVTYPVINSSVSRLRVDMLLDDSYTHGENEIIIEKLVGTFNSEIFEYSLEDNNTDDIYVNGNIEIIDMSIYALNGDSIEYVSQDSTVTIEITFDNDTLYDINSIELQFYQRIWGAYNESITEFTINDEKSIISFTVNATDRLYQISVYSFDYSSERLSSMTKVVSDVDESILVVEQDTIHYIYTPDDLQNIESGYVYQLANDIDLSGFSFIPIESFYGYLNGNGHVISNLTLIKSYTDEDVKVGLFESLEFAIVKNLVISDSNIVITHRTTNGEYYQSYVGVLAGSIAQQSVITNIVISANVDVNQENMNGNIRVGLLAGYIELSRLSEIRVSGTLTGTDYVGGIAGSINQSIIRNSYANVDLNVTGRYTANFAGEIYNSTITSCYATGINSNTTSYETGGFATYISNSILKDVLSFTKDRDGAYKNPVLYYWDSRAEGTYSPAYNDLFVTSTIENMVLHAKDNWDSNIWTFTKELPMIKRIPTIDLKVDIKTVSSLSFNIEVLDFDEVGSINSVALYLKGVLVEELIDFENIEFEGLRYSSRYELRVVYGYDYEDGLGQQLIQKSIYAYTNDKENVPSVDYKDVVIDQDSIVFDYDLTDPLDIATFDSISLYDQNDQLIDTIYQVPYQFNDLYANSNYYILVNYTYEFIEDTWGENLLEAIYEFKTTSYDLPTVTFGSSDNGTDYIDFSLVIEDDYNLGVITAVQLYANDTKVDELETFDSYRFEGLLSNYWYRVRVTYTYDLNDQQGLNTFTVENYYYTDYINNPYYYFNELNTNFDSVKFTYTEEDPHDISTLISIDLYDGLTKIDSLDTFEVISFNNLLSNHQYYVRFVHQFDKQDGNGLVTNYHQHSFVTTSYETPEVNFDNIEVTQDTLTYEGLLNDGYNLGQITEMIIYLDDVLIEQTTTNTIQASDLLENTEYQLFVSYEYNLEDGKGIISKQATYTFETAPFADIAGVSIINNTAVAVGDSLSLNIDLNNPNEIVFEEVVINGIKYDVSSYTVSKLRVDILLTETIGQLDTTLTVEKLIGTYNNKLYTYNVDQLNTVDTYINGDIYIESIDILNSSQDVLVYGLLNETVTVKINFYNPSNYDISNIEISKTNYYNWNSYNIDDFTIEGNSYMFTTQIEWEHILTIRVENFTYANNEIEERTKQSNFENNLIILKDLEIRNIYTADDLQDIISGYHYVLKNDIDLSNSLWTPIEDFKGIFDGSGYTISNLTFIKTYLDQEVYAGLFTTINFSEIRNVTLENVSMITTLRSNNNDSYCMQVGALAGSINRSVIENVIISGQVDLKNETYQWGNYAGLLAGTIHDSTLDFIYVSGYVKSSGEAAGIASRLERSDATHIIADVSLRSENNSQVSGLFNDLYNSNLENAYAVGRSYNQEYYNSFGLVYNASNSTIQNTFSYLYGASNRILRSIAMQNNSKFTNVYTPVNDGYTIVMPIADVLDLMRDLWGNEYFVYINDYPLFKIEPKLEIKDVVSDNSSITFELYIDDIHQIGDINTILLYQDQVLINEITDFEDLTFTSLRYGSTYKIEVSYIYDYQDGTGEKEIITTYRIRTTDPEDVPEITITNVVVGQEDVSFDYDLVDDLDITISMVYNLLDQDYNVLQTSTTLKTFDNLYSDTTYFLEVIAIYEFDGDEFGPSQASEILEFTTHAKSVPTMTFNNVSSTNDSIAFNFNITDIDNVGAFTELSLYQENTLIETLSDLSLRTFDNLDAYTSYTIYAVYTYNLNQGLADVEIIDDYTVKTTPVVELTETKLMNTSAIVSGDAISLKLYLNNPNGLEFSDVMINGQVYSVTQLSQTELLVEFITDENYIGGLTDLVVTNLYATYESQTFNITTSSNNTAQILINGDIYVESIASYLNDDSIYYTYINQEIEIVVQFYNPTGYDIDSINIYRERTGNTNYDSTQFTLNEDHTKATIDLTVGNTTMYEYFRVDSFEYSNEDLETRSRLSAADPNHIVLMTTDDPIEITTALELQNMTNGHTYILANDIDLEGFNWEPIENFEGTFDGAGYTINNLTIVKTYEDQTPYVGLFANTSVAIIKNIDLENVNISITTRTYINNSYQMFVGALIGRVSPYTVIENISVTGTITANNTTDSSTYVGAIAGFIESSVIDNIYVDAFITNNSINWGSSTGGIAGQISNSIAQDIYVDVVIDAYRYAGGIFGRLDSSVLNIAEAHVLINGYEYLAGIAASINRSDVSNVYSTGRINATNWVCGGGIVNDLRDYSSLEYAYSTIIFGGDNAGNGIVREVSNSTIRFAYTTSKYVINDNYARAIDYVYDSYEFEDVYTLYQYTDYATYSNNLASIQQIMLALFDHSIWDFETLDEQGNPTLQ